MSILKMKDVTFSYSSSGEKVLSLISKDFELGKFYAIMGKSGAGKSTLLSLLAGLDEPDVGEIVFDDDNIKDIEKDAIITRDVIQNNNKAIEYIEDKYGINFTKKINVLGNLEVIKGLVREGIGNVILPYYSVYKDIRKGTFKVIAKIDEIKDGYELIITKDKKDLSQITKFIDLVKSHKIVMEGSRN